MSKEKEFNYSVYVDCQNCGSKKFITIKRGRQVKEEKCPICGCETLVKQIGATGYTTP